MTQYPGILKSTDLKAQERAIKLRHDKDALIVAGTGVIAFGFWSLVKSMLMIGLNMPEIMEVNDLLTAESWEVASVFLYEGTVLLAELLLRIYVGTAARAEGRDRLSGKKAYLYPLGAVVLAGISVSSFIQCFKQVWLAGAVDEDDIMALLLELTSLATLAEIVISAVRVRWAEKIRTGERQRNAD